MPALTTTVLAVAGVLLTATLYVAGFLSALHALGRTRTVEGTIGWVVSLLLFPPAALPAYWLLRTFKFQSYADALARARREHRPQLAGLLAGLRSGRAAALPAEVLAIERLAELPFTAGNRVRLLPTGRETFDAMFAAIAAAERVLLVQSFIVRDDRLGREVQARLAARARAGVRVHFLGDAMGCHGLPREYDDGLAAAGVRVARFRTSRRWADRWQVNFRNHRKLLVADGRVALVGGNNIGVEYLGEGPLGPWHDAHVEVTGPAAAAAQASFLADWYWATREVIEPLPPGAPAGDAAVLPLATGPTDEFERCTMFFLHALGMARRRLWIATPYFVPDESIEDALRLAALRGVDVRVVLPGRPDHRIVWLAAFAFLDELRGTDIRVFRRHDGFLHRKVVLVDDALAAVGTANFDNRSFRLNFELTMAAACPRLAADVAAMFEADFAASDEVGGDELRRRPYPFQVAARAARLLGPVL
ncbi:MAG: cardiolipin synthase [Limisphaerales bacterium]